MTSHLRRHWAAYGLLVFLAAGLVVRVLYALPDLDPNRFWDERVGVWNVESLVGEGRIRPHNGFYPSLSYLPHAGLIALSQGLYRATGAEALRMIDPSRPFGVTEGAMLVARMVSVVVGTLTIGFVFLLGRRLASPLVGLVAAAILSASWTHLFVSVKFKPDVLAVFFALLAFWWLLDALDDPGEAGSPGWGRWALVGVGVGLSASSKFLGASMAVPALVATLWTGARSLRAWARLALAGTTAIATFVVLNPWLGLIVEDVSRTQRDYARKAERAAASHWTMFVEEARWIVDEHGLWVALFVVVGCLGLGAVALGRRVPFAPGAPDGPDRPRRGRLGAPEAAALLAAIVGHSALYGFATSHFKNWNYLPVTPFVCFAAAWAMVGLASRASMRLPDRLRRPAGVALWTAVLLVFLAVPVSRTYAATVPTSWEVVSDRLNEHPAAPTALVYAQDVRTRVERKTVDPEFVLVEMDDLERARAEQLARADAVVFRASELDGPRGEFYRGLLEAEDRAATRVGQRAFRVRGPELVVSRSRWQVAGEPLRRDFEPAEDGRVTVPLDRPIAAGETISIAVLLDGRGGRRRIPGAIRVRGIGEVPVFRYRAGIVTWVTTSKIRPRRSLDRLIVEVSAAPHYGVPRAVRLYRWRMDDGSGKRLAN